MRVEFLAKFNSDLNQIHLKSVKKSIVQVIERVKNATTISDIPQIKKLKGFRSAYRIRVGEYRVGIFVEGDKVEFARILNRKEIYRYFP